MRYIYNYTYIYIIIFILNILIDHEIYIIIHIYIYVCIPIGKVSAPSVKTQITMGRRAFRKPEKSAQIYGNQHGTLWANNNLFISCLVLFMAQKIGIILWKLHLCGHCLRLLWTLNNFLEQRLWDAKFHHNYSSSSSSKTRQNKTKQDKTRQNKTKQDKTRQNKTKQVTCFRRYSGDTRRYPKISKKNPSPTQSNSPMELTQTQYPLVI